MSSGRIPRPTPAGVGLAGASAALYALGVSLGYPQLLAVATAGLVGFVAAVVLAAWRPGLRLTRSFHPPSVTVGEPAVALLQVDNTSGWPSAPVAVVDRIGHSDVRLAVRALRRRDSTLVRYQLPTHRRGRIALGPLRLERSDPFGLLTSTQDHGAEEVLWVHPRTLPMSALPAGLVVDTEDPVSDSALHGSLTFSSLREYVPGDERRLIHWRSSARLDTLVVRQYVDTNEPRSTVLLDTRDHLWSDQSFEEAVEVAASVVQSLNAQGHGVSLHVLGLTPARARELGATSGAEHLAAAERIDDPNPAALLSLIGAGEGGGSLVVVTGLVEPNTALMLGRQGNRFSPVILCSIVPGSSATWHPRGGVTVVRGPSSQSLAQAWNRMVLQ